jgi:hypothetical protein
MKTLSLTIQYNQVNLQGQEVKNESTIKEVLLQGTRMKYERSFDIGAYKHTAASVSNYK